MDLKVTGNALGLDFAPEVGKSWLVSGLVITRRAPQIGHVPIRSAPAGLPSSISATITAPDAVEASTKRVQ
jgi:hypothetical protein